MPKGPKGEKRPADVIGAAVGDPRLIQLNQILRTGHDAYFETPSKLRIEHDTRAQTSTTYCHIFAESERVFENDSSVHYVERNGLKLWYFEEADVIISFKKMDEKGCVNRHGSKQQENFECQRLLDGIPAKPINLRVGYLLDQLRQTYVRTQIAIAIPNGKSVSPECAAIHPPEERQGREHIWYDIKKQASFL
jgi:hypothetical protein